MKDSMDENQLSPSNNNDDESTSSRGTDTPTSIIDPGDEKENSNSDSDSEEYFKPIKKLKMMPSSPSSSSPPPNSPEPTDNSKPLTSFLIKDILSYKPKHHSSPCTNVTYNEHHPINGIVRPWDLDTNNFRNHRIQNHLKNTFGHPHPSSLVQNRRPRSADDDSRSERSESDSLESPASTSALNAITSPLDALFEMTSKAFDGVDGSEKSSDASADHLNLFSNRAAQAKKKRKSRTAFTNHQIFELEKRFLYQKYLSPADRDEIAQSLGLTNAQVITWFQNRRAKLKRDMEELKKDVDAAKITGVHKTLLDNIQDLSLIKKTDLVAALHHQVKNAQ